MQVTNTIFITGTYIPISRPGDVDQLDNIIAAENSADCGADLGRPSAESHFMLFLFLVLIFGNDS